MTETIFEKITDVYHTVNLWEWHPSLGVEPKEFSTMEIDRKTQLCCSILQKLRYILNHPADMLISWSWWEKHRHCTFEDWLQFQINQVPDIIYQPKDKKILNRAKAQIRKMLKLL